MAKVLLVEDDNNLREIYEARLQAEGYEIVSARDGEEALVVAKEAKPDLVISDVMMPKISGFEMLDILRNTPGLEGVKVIMLTALGQADDQARAGQLGADRYLVKSQVTLEDIVNTAHVLLEDGQPAAPNDATPPTDTSGNAPAAAPAAAAPADVPMASPPAEPAAETGAAPEAPAEPAAAPNDDAPAQSSAQEEAAVESQIENFVQDAPATPPPAAEPAPAAAETPAAPEVTTPETLPSSSSGQPADGGPAAAAAADDQVLNDAMSNLMKSTASGLDSSTDGGAAEAEAPSASEAVGGTKKVIQPLDGEPKPSINELLAREEAKDIVQSAPAPTVGGPATPAAPASEDDSTPPSAAPGSSFDPNSIAL